MLKSEQNSSITKNINSAKIKDRIRELLKEHKKDALMSKSLATIKRDVKINFNLDDARFGNIKQEEVVKADTSPQTMPIGTTYRGGVFGDDVLNNMPSI